MWALLLISGGIVGQSEAPPLSLEVELSVTGDPQIAVWLEDDTGQFLNTLMVTRLVGSFGLGNRPGRPDFGGGYLWPYGRREQTLPVWAHRRGVTYDRIVFQDCKESWLGWHEAVSSAEPFYCRPLTQTEMQLDALTCPTVRFATDKGIPLRLIDPNLSPACREIWDTYPQTSVYPPRNDIKTRDPARDWAGLSQFREMNELDAVSRATPAPGENLILSHIFKPTDRGRAYVLWVEVNQAYDDNEHHAYAFFEDPRLTDYGIAIVGQPSVVWRVPIAVTSTPAVYAAAEHAGYGSPTGESGILNPPDGTISTDTPGSGVQRLLLRSDSVVGSYRVKATIGHKEECEAPEPPPTMLVTAAQWSHVDIEFMTQDVPRELLRYELRYAPGADSIRTNDEFMAATPGPDLPIGAHGEIQTYALELPRPDTTYTIAVRAHNVCGTISELSPLQVRTAFREFMTVDACYVATAAHGTDYQADVRALRRFRDRHLMTTPSGRQVIDGYYRLSPPIADLIRRSPWMRTVVRAQLAPLAPLAAWASNAQ